MNKIIKIAKKELKLNINNYWFILSAFIFCVLNFVIIYFADLISGDYSQTDIRSLSLSIINLQMYTIPLLSFVLSYDSILSERETGMLALILSYKVTIFDIFFGKLIGNSIVFILAFFLGFLPISIYLYFIGISLSVILKFILISMWLSFIFNFFALYISNMSKDRTFVILFSIFVWLFFIFLYDMIFTFFTVIFYGSISNNILNFFLFLNPAEIFRIISIFIFIPTDASDLFGINVGLLNLYIVLISVFIWMIIPLFSFLFLTYKRI
jgi:Cu-processing system permease protein